MLIRTHIHHPLIDLTLFAKLDGNGEVGLKAVMFGNHTTLNGTNSSLLEEEALDGYKEILVGFLEGRLTSLGGIPLCFDGCTPFQRRVLEAARSIEWGRVASYSELAEMAGSPGAVRAVASVMRNNRFPLIVPCHRIIRKNGQIGGFMGMRNGKWVDLKRKLLERERKKRLE